MPTVLVVDDDTDNRELLAAILRGLTYHVLTAGDAVAAARIMESGRVDAVMLDVRLPGVSGIDLCRQLRRRPHTANMPVILVSADADAERIAAGLAAGADDYLVKPYTRADVISRLDAALAVSAGGAGTKTLTPSLYAALAARPAAPAPRPTPAQPVRTA